MLSTNKIFTYISMYSTIIWNCGGLVRIMLYTDVKNSRKFMIYITARATSQTKGYYAWPLLQSIHTSDLFYAWTIHNNYYSFISTQLLYFLQSPVFPPAVKRISQITYAQMRRIWMQKDPKDPFCKLCKRPGLHHHRPPLNFWWQNCFFPCFNVWVTNKFFIYSTQSLEDTELIAVVT